eukprot:TRINITY_DN19022_c0_g1_i1.p1 TRINITY_DN19022_c0_g1~~TRINITY_DN19022_c0_g1_i1.p1  ORF type:complete len:359 (+),score=81.23 TRINITY_DN19022_c0_g1_i1:1145-2221(+)
MNSSPTSEEATVCGNWNSSSSSIMSFVGPENGTHKQFWDWDNNTHNPNINHPLIIPTSTSFNIDFSSSTPAPPTNFPQSYAQITHFPVAETGFLKREDGCFGVDVGSHSNSRIGLNLGHRTYFSSRETAVIDRLFRRSRGFYQANQIPRCQAEGCKVDLTNAKHYHRRHRVCEFHSKATKVLLAGGMEQRFCQQCSRFHALAEFDEVKRSCRKRLADHNRRRRKPQPGTTSDSPARKTPQNGIDKNQETEKTRASSYALFMTRDIKASNQEELQFEQKAAVTQLQKGPSLSLSGAGLVEKFSESQITYTHQPFSSPSSFFDRGSVSPSSCMMDSHQQQPEELQNLLQLGHAMFEVEFL